MSRLLFSLVAALLITAMLPGVALSEEPPSDSDGIALPKGAVQRLGRTLRFDPWQYGAVFSPDGSRMAASGEPRRTLGGECNSVDVFDVQTGALLTRFKCDPIEGLFVFYPKGEKLCSLKHDGSIRVWEMPSGKEVSSSPPAELHGIEEREVEFALVSPDGKSLFTYALDWGLQRRNIESGEILESIVCIPEEIIAVHEHPDGQRWLFVDLAGAAYLWDPVTGEMSFKTGTIEGLNAEATFTPDGREILLTCGWGKQMVRLDAITGAEIERVSMEEDESLVSVSHPNGKHFVSLSIDGHVQLWQRAPLKMLHTQRLHWLMHESLRDEDVSLRWTPNADRLLIVLESPFAVPISVPVDILHKTDVIPTKDNFVVQILSLDGNRLAVLHANGSLRTWNLLSGEKEAEVLRKNESPSNRGVAWLGGDTFAFGTDRGIVEVVNLATGDVVRKLDEFLSPEMKEKREQGSDVYVTVLDSGDSESLFVSCRSKLFSIDPSSGEARWSVEAGSTGCIPGKNLFHVSEVSDLITFQDGMSLHRIHPEGKTATVTTANVAGQAGVDSKGNLLRAAGDAKAGIRLLDADTLEDSHSWDVLLLSLRRIACHPSRQVMLIRARGELKLFNLDTGVFDVELRYQGGPEVWIDDDRFAMGHDDGSVTVWSLSNTK